MLLFVCLLALLLLLFFQIEFLYGTALAALELILIDQAGLRFLLTAATRQMTNVASLSSFL